MIPVAWGTTGSCVSTVLKFIVVPLYIICKKHVQIYYTIKIY